MSARFKRPKRILRIASARLPIATKRALLSAEFANEADVDVPVGTSTAHLAAPDVWTDYRTIYGALVDRHFDADVAGASVLDIGAHKGYFALRCLSDGAASVDSYEPASPNLASLERSAAGRSDWTVHGVAVGATAGSVTLHLAPGSWGHSIHTPVGGGATGTEEVEVVALASVLRSVGAHGRDVVVKINVEGAAGEMILGTEPSDWRTVRLLWIDVEANDPVPLVDITEHLALCGLAYRRADGHRHLFESAGDRGGS